MFKPELFGYPQIPYTVSTVFKNKREVNLETWVEHFRRPCKERNKSLNKMFETDLILMKRKYVFLDSTQIMGRTLSAFGIQNVCGEVSKTLLQKCRKKKCTAKRFEKTTQSKITRSFVQPQNRICKKTVKTSVHLKKLITQYPPVAERWSDAAFKKFHDFSSKDISKDQSYTYINDESQMFKSKQVNKSLSSTKACIRTDLSTQRQNSSDTYENQSDILKNNTNRQTDQVKSPQKQYQNNLKFKFVNNKIQHSELQDQSESNCFPNQSSTSLQPHSDSEYFILKNQRNSLKNGNKSLKIEEIQSASQFYYNVDSDKISDSSKFQCTTAVINEPEVTNSLVEKKTLIKRSFNKSVKFDDHNLCSFAPTPQYVESSQEQTVVNCEDEVNNSNCLGSSDRFKNIPEIKQINILSECEQVFDELLKNTTVGKITSSAKNESNGNRTRTLTETSDDNGSDSSNANELSTSNLSLELYIIGSKPKDLTTIDAKESTSSLHCESQHDEGVIKTKEYDTETEAYHKSDIVVEETSHSSFIHEFKNSTKDQIKYLSCSDEASTSHKISTTNQKTEIVHKNKTNQQKQGKQVFQTSNCLEKMDIKQTVGLPNRASFLPCSKNEIVIEGTPPSSEDIGEKTSSGVTETEINQLFRNQKDQNISTNNTVNKLYSNDKGLTSEKMLPQEDYDEEYIPLSDFEGSVESNSKDECEKENKHEVIPSVKKSQVSQVSTKYNMSVQAVLQESSFRSHLIAKGNRDTELLTPSTNIPRVNLSPIGSLSDREYFSDDSVLSSQYDSNEVNQAEKKCVYKFESPTIMSFETTFNTGNTSKFVPGQISGTGDCSYEIDPTVSFSTNNCKKNHQDKSSDINLNVQLLLSRSNLSLNTKLTNSKCIEISQNETNNMGGTRNLNENLLSSLSRKHCSYSTFANLQNNSCAIMSNSVSDEVMAEHMFNTEHSSDKHIVLSPKSESFVTIRTESVDNRVGGAFLSLNNTCNSLRSTQLELSDRLELNKSTHLEKIRCSESNEILGPNQSSQIKDGNEAINKGSSTLPDPKSAVVINQLDSKINNATNLTQKPPNKYSMHSHTKIPNLPQEDSNEEYIPLSSCEESFESNEAECEKENNPEVIPTSKTGFYFNKKMSKILSQKDFDNDYIPLSNCCESFESSHEAYYENDEVIPNSRKSQDSKILEKNNIIVRAVQHDNSTVSQHITKKEKKNTGLLITCKNTVSHIDLKLSTTGSLSDREYLSDDGVLRSKYNSKEMYKNISDKEILENINKSLPVGEKYIPKYNSSSEQANKLKAQNRDQSEQINISDKQTCKLCDITDGFDKIQEAQPIVKISDKYKGMSVLLSPTNSIRDLSLLNTFSVDFSTPQCSKCSQEDTSRNEVVNFKLSNAPYKNIEKTTTNDTLSTKLDTTITSLVKVSNKKLCKTLFPIQIQNKSLHPSYSVINKVKNKEFLCESESPITMSFKTTSERVNIPKTILSQIYRNENGSCRIYPTTISTIANNYEKDTKNIHTNNMMETTNYGANFESPLSKTECSNSTFTYLQKDKSDHMSSLVYAQERVDNTYKKDISSNEFGEFFLVSPITEGFLKTRTESANSRVGEVNNSLDNTFKSSRSAQLELSDTLELNKSTQLKKIACYESNVILGPTQSSQVKVGNKPINKENSTLHEPKSDVVINKLDSEIISAQTPKQKPPNQDSMHSHAKVPNLHKEDSFEEYIPLSSCEEASFESSEAEFKKENNPEVIPNNMKSQESQLLAVVQEKDIVSSQLIAQKEMRITGIKTSSKNKVPHIHLNSSLSESLSDYEFLNGSKIMCSTRSIRNPPKKDFFGNKNSKILQLNEKLRDHGRFEKTTNPKINMFLSVYNDNSGRETTVTALNSTPINNSLTTVRNQKRRELPLKNNTFMNHKQMPADKDYSPHKQQETVNVQAAPLSAEQEVLTNSVIESNNKCRNKVNNNFIKDTLSEANRNTCSDFSSSINSSKYTKNIEICFTDNSTTNYVSTNTQNPFYSYLQEVRSYQTEKPNFKRFYSTQSNVQTYQKETETKLNDIDSRLPRAFHLANSPSNQVISEITTQPESASGSEEISETDTHETVTTDKQNKILMDFPQSFGDIKTNSSNKVELSFPRPISFNNLQSDNMQAVEKNYTFSDQTKQTGSDHLDNSKKKLFGTSSPCKLQLKQRHCNENKEYFSTNKENNTVKTKYDTKYLTQQNNCSENGNKCLDNCNPKLNTRQRTQGNKITYTENNSPIIVLKRGRTQNVTQNKNRNNTSSYATSSKIALSKQSRRASTKNVVLEVPELKNQTDKGIGDRCSSPFEPMSTKPTSREEYSNEIGSKASYLQVHELEKILLNENEPLRLNRLYLKNSNSNKRIKGNSSDEDISVSSLVSENDMTPSGDFSFAHFNKNLNTAIDNLKRCNKNESTQVTRKRKHNYDMDIFYSDQEVKRKREKRNLCFSQNIDDSNSMFPKFKSSQSISIFHNARDLMSDEPNFKDDLSNDHAESENSINSSQSSQGSDLSSVKTDSKFPSMESSFGLHSPYNLNRFDQNNYLTNMFDVCDSSSKGSLSPGQEY